MACGLVPLSSAARNLHKRRKMYAPDGIQTYNPVFESRASYQRGKLNFIKRKLGYCRFKKLIFTY